MRDDTVTRISRKLLPAIDKAVKEQKDDFGMPLFKSRRDFVDEAVKQLLRKGELAVRE